MSCDEGIGRAGLEVAKLAVIGTHPVDQIKIDAAATAARRGQLRQAFSSDYGSGLVCETLGPLIYVGLKLRKLGRRIATVQVLELPRRSYSNFIHGVR